MHGRVRELTALGVGPDKHLLHCTIECITRSRAEMRLRIPRAKHWSNVGDTGRARETVSALDSSNDACNRKYIRCMQ